MARGLSVLRKVVLSVGYSAAGLVLLTMAFALVEGTMLVPNGQRRGQPKPWVAMPVESPFGRAIGAVVLGIAGGYLIWLAVKEVRGRRRK
jgi:hypothetical protein